MTRPRVAPERFRGREDQYPGGWREFPANWHASAETAVQDRETLRVAMRAIAELPPALPDSEVAQFEQHLELCEGCRSYVEQMRITIATVGRIDESDVPDELRAGLLAAFRGRPR